MGSIFIRGARGQADHYELLQLLGVPGGKLPDHALLPQRVQGILVWVEERGPKHTNRWGQPTRAFSLRVRAECPGCNRHFAASRLQQHVCKGIPPNVPSAYDGSNNY